MPFRESGFEKPKTEAEVGPGEEKPIEEQPKEEAVEQPEKLVEIVLGGEESAEKPEEERRIEQRWAERLEKLRVIKEEIEEAFGGRVPLEIATRIRDKDQEIYLERGIAYTELKTKRQEEAAKKLESI